MKTLITVIGAGEDADPRACELAYELGRLIAGQGWVLLNGGRGAGVMEASAAGAKEAGGLTVGILPTDSPEDVSTHIDIAISTGLGHARNYVNVLSGEAVVALRGRAGTLSEISLALAVGKPVILLGFEIGEAFDHYVESGLLESVSTPEAAVELIRRRLSPNA